jgi:kinesin family protein 5
MGSNIDDQDNKGIIPRIIEQIFESIKQAPKNMEFTVKVAYMEIYMEKVKDLLVRKLITSKTAFKYLISLYNS